MGNTKVSVVTLSQESTCCYIRASTQTHVSLDTLPYTQFRSGIILNSMDLIPTLVVKRKTKRHLQRHKQKKKRK